MFTLSIMIDKPRISHTIWLNINTVNLKRTIECALFTERFIEMINFASNGLRVHNSINCLKFSN